MRTLESKLKNPIIRYSKELNDNKIEKDVRVWCSVIIATGCRSGEVRTYKVIDVEGDIISLWIKVFKKERKNGRAVTKLRHKPERIVRIDTSIFGLKPEDYEECQGKFGDYHCKHKDDFRSATSYRRRFKFHIGKTPRDYRRELATYAIRKGKDKTFVRDLLCHENITTTDHYLETNKIDFTELIRL